MIQFWRSFFSPCTLIPAFSTSLVIFSLSLYLWSYSSCRLAMDYVNVELIFSLYKNIGSSSFHLSSRNNSFALTSNAFNGKVLKALGFVIMPSLFMLSCFSNIPRRVVYFFLFPDYIIQFFKCLPETSQFSISYCFDRIKRSLW